MHVSPTFSLFHQAVILNILYYLDAKYVVYVEYLFLFICYQQRHTTLFEAEVHKKLVIYSIINTVARLGQWSL